MGKSFIISARIWALVFFCSSSLSGQGYFEMSPEVIAAYESVTRLRMDEAKQKIARVKSTEPDNLLIYLVENYIDFFDLFINEEEGTYDKIKANKKRRLELIKEGDKSSPFYLFCIAEINLQWATAGLKFGERIGPMRQVYSAYNLLKENQANHPDFVANKKSLSIIHALSESLPGIVRTLFNVKGSIEQGTQEIADLAEYSDNHEDFVFREETYAIYAYILFYQNNEKEKAYNILKAANLDFTASPLLCFLMANITQKTGRNDEALEILKARPQGSEYMPFYYLDFMYGKYLLYKLDNGALDHMNVFIENFKGRHFIKEAYQKLAWYALAADENIVHYKEQMANCISKGNTLVDEDKQAQKEAKHNDIPNVSLLQARLLYDGGYYQKAYQKLVLQAHQFTDNKQLIEFNYRMGRITQALGNLTGAIDYYLQTINRGENQDSYFACNSALQTALIFEDQKEYKKAKQLFKRCLKIEPAEYQASLHQKAKSGLARIKIGLRKK